MAVFDTVTPRRSAGSNPLAVLFEIVDLFLRQRAERQTRAELLRLSDAELDDIGLSRYDVLGGNFHRHA